jgi:hypothetical protein
VTTDPVQPLGARPQKKGFDVNLKHTYPVRPSSDSDEGMPDAYRMAMRELNAKCWQLSREIIARERKSK